MVKGFNSNQSIIMKIVKKIVKAFGYKISKTSKILLLDEVPFVAIKEKLIGDNLVFFDIGANWGQTTTSMCHHYPDAKIYGFEPSKNCFDSLKSNFDSDTIRFYNLAVGSSCGQLEFYEYSWSALNSLLKRAYWSATIL